jgi:phosphatidylserine/phosphatidylglycerophosphate/cardiolipin synthase-like enzyme
MDDAHAVLAAKLAVRLPSKDLRALAASVGAGPTKVQAFRASASSTPLRDACDSVLAALKAGGDPAEFAGALRGADAATRWHRERSSVDVVWTGPASSVTINRLTAAVVVEILDDAASEILLIGYAVHSEPTVTVGLARAAARGVQITLLLERTIDNPGYTGGATAFADVPARRLAWLAAQRPDGGASLHAKALVVDRATALVGSANITSWALERNLECGLLVRGGSQPKAIHDHVDGLVAAGILTKVT